MRPLSLVIIASITFLFTLPRFDYQQHWIIKKYVLTQIDYIQYEKMTNYMKGEYPYADSLQKPYTYRPFVPYLASFIPLRPLTAINIINEIFLIGTTLIFYFWIYSEKKSYKFALLAGLLFGASYPVFMYGAVGIVDPIFIFFLTLSTFVINKKQYVWIPFLMIPGTLTKELMVAIIPFYYLIMDQDENVTKSRKISLTLISVLIYMALVVIIRLLAPGYTPNNDAWKWIPSSAILITNVKKITTWLGLILMLGIPGFVALWSFIKNRTFITSPDFPYLIGFLTGVAVFIFSLFSSYAGARLIWLSIPFSIPIAVNYFYKRKRRTELYHT